MAHLGQRVRNLRERNGLTQNKLAALLGMHQVTISQIENNERWPSTGVLVRLADVLGVSIDEVAPTLEEVKTREDAMGASR